MQQVDDPPYLPVGTEVSAKYKGAFCEAKVRKVDRNIKCKVAYKLGLGSGTVSDDQIKGDLLRVGATVEARHPDRKDYVEATITKIQDSSQYTVVFDDGDITTLRRSALCLKSGRHFNESETLDQLPLTHPEHFGNPVIGGRRGRRSRHLPEDSSDDEDDNTALVSSSTKHRFSEKEEHIGKVVCIENTETKKKSSRENWFPALVVAPTAQDAVRIRVKDEYLVRSFKDGRYYTVPKKEASDFRRDRISKQNSDAVQAALEYLNNDALPTHWDRDVLFAIQSNCSSETDPEEDDSETSDDEPREEKDHFVAQLYKYMDDRGTPLNKGPSIVNKDVDLYRLFRAVQKLNGYNKVTGQSQWKQIAMRLGYSPVTQSIQNLVKQAYKKFLLPFEEFDRKLGCTMVAHPRANRIKGRSLVRANSVASPKPEKEMRVGGGAGGSGGGAMDESETTSESGPESTKIKRKLSTSSGGGGSSVGKVKAMIDKYEDKIKDESPDEDSKDMVLIKEEKLHREVAKKPANASTKDSKEAKDSFKEIRVEKDTEPVASSSIITSTRTNVKTSKEEQHRSPTGSTQPPNSGTGGSSRKDKLSKRPAPPPPTSNSEERKSSSKKRRPEIDSVHMSSLSLAASGLDKDNDFPIEVGDKLKVFYHEQKVTYEAKVIEISVQQGTAHYLVHYTGWNTRYDEWVPKERIAENLTNNKTNKRAKTGGAPSISKDKFIASGMGSGSSSAQASGASVSTNQTNASKNSFKRGGSRGDSQPPRSTTPSSVASNSSRTKSPATPAQRRTTRGQPSSNNSVRRTSNNTDISSLQTDSDTDSDEPVKKPANHRKIPALARSTTVQSNSTSGNSAGTKTNSNASSEEESLGGGGGASNTKGRDFDLNQIRSELKGFKELKTTSPEDDETTDTEEIKKFEFAASSSVSTTTSETVASEKRKPIVSSDSDSESDSFCDDDSQFSDRTNTLDNLAEKLQDKFKTGKLQTEVFKKMSAGAVAAAAASASAAATQDTLAVDKVATLKASGIEKIIKNSLADKSKILPDKINARSLLLTDRSPIKEEPRESDHKPKSPIKHTAKVVLMKGVPEKTLFPDRNKLTAAPKDPAQFTVSAKAPSAIAVSKTDPESENTANIADPGSVSIKMECDVYEFKEPEPFEYEVVKKLSPEVDKSKTKKKSLDAPTTIDKSPTTSNSGMPSIVKKVKKSPVKEEKFKGILRTLELDEPIHSPPPMISPPLMFSSSSPSGHGSAKPDSLFDSLRKSPSFNLTLQSQNERDDSGASTSQLIPIKEPESRIMSPSAAPSTSSAAPIAGPSKPSFISSFVETSPPVVPIASTSIASPPLSLIVPLAVLMESPPKARASTSTSPRASGSGLDDKLKIFVPGQDSIDPDDRPVALDTVKKIHFSEELYVVPPKADKPSSIADKVLKALNQHKTDAAAAAAASTSKDFIAPSPPVNPIVKSEQPVPAAHHSSMSCIPFTDPPKIEIHALLKRDPSHQSSSPATTSSSTSPSALQKSAQPISPDLPKVDILETKVPSKHQDLSVTIHKLESVIQQTADLNELSDDSEDSTDSERRLIIQDEDEDDDDDDDDEDDDDDDNMLNPDEHMVDTTASVGKDLKTRRDNKADEKESVPKEFERIKSPVQQTPKEPKPVQEDVKEEVPRVRVPVKDKLEIARRIAETIAKKSAEQKEKEKKALLDINSQKKTPEQKKSSTLVSVEKQHGIDAKSLLQKPFVKSPEQPSGDQTQKTPPIHSPDTSTDQTRLVPRIFASVAASIPVVPTSVIIPTEPTTLQVAPVKLLDVPITGRAESPLATPLTPFESRPGDDDDDDDEDEIADLVIVTKEDDDEETDDDEDPNESATTDAPTTTTTSATSTTDSDPAVSVDSTSSHQQKESLSLLLCEETIPGSPTPPTCTKDQGPAELPSIIQPHTDSTPSNTSSKPKSFDTMFGSTANLHPIEADMKSVPMDLEPPSSPTVPPEPFKPTPQTIISSSCMASPPLASQSQPLGSTANNPTSSLKEPSATSSHHPVLVSPVHRQRDSLSNDDSDDVRKHVDPFAGEPATRKRRHSKKSSECDTSLPKRRKGNSRRNTVTGSESEDNSEYTHKSSGGASSHRGTSSSSVKPGQFNFLVHLDPAMNSNQRIGIIHKKIQDLRKTYNHLKAELASIDRRRKKLRRRERETKKNLQKCQQAN